MPGDEWNRDRNEYFWRPKANEVQGTFALSETLAQAEYVLALAILDPAGMVPSARFAMCNYYNGGLHPIGLMGVGRPVHRPELDHAEFDGPADDTSLYYVVTMK